MTAGGLSRSSEEAVYLGKNDQTFVDVLVVMLCIAHEYVILLFFYLGFGIPNNSLRIVQIGSYDTRIFS